MILAMMFCFTMNMVADLLFYSFNVYNFSYKLTDGDPLCINDEIFTWTECVYLTFFSMAVVINIRNWIYYFIKIGEMAKSDKRNKQIFVLDCVIGVVIFLNVVFAFI